MADSALPTELQGIGCELCAVLTREARRYAGARAAPIRLEDARFTRVIDPANGLPGYEGVWRDAHAQKCGSLTLNSDGGYCGEFDLLLPHPDKPEWFIEAVTVWGRAGVIKTEPRLLAAL